MEVIIDGVKYIPESYFKVVVGGVEYDSVGNWLMNIHAKLLNAWHAAVRDGKDASSQSREIEEFVAFAEKYLGFVPDNGGYLGFVEKGGGGE